MPRNEVRRQALQLSYILHHNLALAIGNIPLKAQHLHGELVAQGANPLPCCIIFIDTAQADIAAAHSPDSGASPHLPCWHLPLPAPDTPPHSSDNSVACAATFCETSCAQIAQFLIRRSIRQQRRPAPRQIESPAAPHRKARSVFSTVREPFTASNACTCACAAARCASAQPRTRAHPTRPPKYAVDPPVLHPILKPSPPLPAPQLLRPYCTSLRIPFNF